MSSNNFNSSANQQRSGSNNQQQQQGQQQSGAWNNQQQQQGQQQSGAWNNQQQQQGLNTYTSSNQPGNVSVERVLLPTRFVEKPAAVHEQIRKELIEEVQPVINVEKLHTEVHQVTQPLFDKEVRPVHIENRTLNSEYLPEVRTEGRGSRAQSDSSTTKYLDTATVVVEKPAQYTEIERKQIIEEVQPVIYKETIVPTVIQETKPMFQKVVEGPVYSQDTLPAKEVANRSFIAPAYKTSTEVIAPTRESYRLPTQVVEKQAAVHEEIRRETIEEITPVWNVEKLKTEVHQITAPLYDKEVRPVTIERKTLNAEILPEVLLDGRGFRAVDDTSSTRYMDTKTSRIEKPAIFNEVDRLQIIEEIQPVIYKETVVPSVIRETKPVFQKIVEGPVYVQETLAPQSLLGSNFHYPQESSQIENAPREFQQQQQQQQYPQQQYPQQQQQQYPQQQQFPVMQQQQPLIERIVIVEQDFKAPPQQQARGQAPHLVLEETKTTTTTTTTAAAAANASAPAKKHHLFHRHSADTNANSQSSSGRFGDQSRGTGPNDTQHFHNERMAPNGQKIIEDTTTTRSHTEQVLPARLN